MKRTKDTLYGHIPYRGIVAVEEGVQQGRRHLRVQIRLTARRVKDGVVGKSSTRQCNAVIGLIISSSISIGIRTVVGGVGIFQNAGAATPLLLGGNGTHSHAHTHLTTRFGVTIATRTILARSHWWGRRRRRRRHCCNDGGDAIPKRRRRSGIVSAAVGYTTGRLHCCCCG